MRENWWSNRIFIAYSDILDHCCFAWNRLTDQPWRIMSLGLRDWAHGFRSTGAGIKARLNEHGDAVVSFPSHLAHGDDALKVAYKVYETRRTQGRIFDTVKHLIQEGRYVAFWDEMLLRLSGAMYR